LKKIGVNRPDTDPVLLAKLDDFGSRLISAKIPEDMNGDGRTKSGKGVDLSGIGQFVVDVDRCGILEELAKAGAGIGKAPTRGLDLELIERVLDFLILGFVHKRGVEIAVTIKIVATELNYVYTLFLKFCLDIEKQ
jgi:hypothetical protein